MSYDLRYERPFIYPGRSKKDALAVSEIILDKVKVMLQKGGKVGISRR